MKKISLVKLIILCLTLSELFYLYSFQLGWVGLLDNIFIVVSLIGILSIVLTKKWNIRSVKLNGFLLLCIALVAYSLFVGLNFTSESTKVGMTTYFSHRNAMPALLAPLALSVGKNNWSLLKKLNSTFIFCLSISVFSYYSYLLLFGEEATQHFTTHIGLALPLLVLTRQKNSIKLFLFVVYTSLLATHFINDNRTLFAVLLFLVVLGYAGKLLLSKYSKILGGIFIVLLLYSYSADVSNYFKYLTANSSRNNANQVEELLSSRTFVYLDFFEDLNGNEVIIGRGIMGYSFSKYFTKVEGGDHFKRFTVEPGVLNVLLKGGIILLILYFFICIHALWSGRTGFSRVRYIVLILLSTQFVFSIFNLSVLSFLFWFLIGSLYSNRKIKFTDDNLSHIYFFA